MKYEMAQLDGFAPSSYDSFTINFSPMSELTLKAIEQLLDKKLESIESTVAKTAALVANLVEDVREIKTDLKAVRTTVDSHTGSLDAIAKDVKDWNQEMTLMRGRMERYEAALKIIGQKLNLDITPLLHP